MLFKTFFFAAQQIKLFDYKGLQVGGLQAGLGDAKIMMIAKPFCWKVSEPA